MFIDIEDLYYKDKQIQKRKCEQPPVKRHLPCMSRLRSCRTFVMRGSRPIDAAGAVMGTYFNEQ